METSLELIIDGHRWLTLALLVLFAMWRLGSAFLLGRWWALRFPVAVALFDLVLLPLWVLLTGNLAENTLTAANLRVGADYANTASVIIAYLLIGWGVARVLDGWLLRRGDSELAERVPELVIGLVYGALLLLGLVVYLWQEGYSFAGLWVSTGVAAAVLGLALQRTLGDLFSGIALGIERPFRLGDWIEVSDGAVVGQVIDLNWRATRLRGWDNATHVIPNSQLAGAALKNLHDSDHLYGPWWFVRVPGEADPRLVTSLLLEATMRCESVLKFPFPIVRLANASTVPYEYMVWVHLKNYPAVFRGREELFREIHASLRRAGITQAPEVHELRTRRAESVQGGLPDVLESLRQLEVAALLTGEELERVAARSSYKHVDSGHLIIAEGAISDAFYVVVGGLVETAIALPGGGRKVIEVIPPGEHLGIASMLADEPSFLEARARSDVTLIRIDLECVRALVAERPDLAERLAQVVKGRVDAAEAARAASRQPVGRLSMRDIRERIEGLMNRPRGPRGGQA